MRRSKESSGVRTCTAPSVSSQPRRTASSAASAASARPCRADQLPDVRHVPPLAERGRRRAGSRPARATTATCSAAQGSSPAPKRPESASCPSAAGRASEPLRPRKEVRSPVAERSGSLAWAKATRPANSWFQAFVARIAPGRRVLLA